MHAHHAVLAGGLFRRHPGHHAAGDNVINMNGLDKSVNRSLGKQINILIKNLQGARLPRPGSGRGAAVYAGCCD